MRANPKLIEMLESFAEGRSRSREFVRKIDEEFWACGLNEDDELNGLLLALDLYGVPLDQHGYDDSMLVFECREALWYLKKQPNQPPEPMSGLTPGHGAS